MRSIAGSFLLLVWMAPVASTRASELTTRLASFVPSADAGGIERYEAKAIARALGSDARGAAFVRARILANLAEKSALRGPSGEAFPMTRKEIESTIVDYEIFKFQSFVSSGVFPKRYFGYFDGKWDTARYELRLQRVVHGAVELANAVLARRGSPVRLTDAEVAVTFIAEGGAILLREKQDGLEQIHPVQGIGLDDIATGFKLYADLVQQLDARFKSHLADVVRWTETPGGPRPALTRLMTFDEALLGVCIMYVYEKELTRTRLAAEHRQLEALPLAEQFVTTSLVYNSGHVFAPDRIEMIRDLRTAGYLHTLSVQNAKKRWPLPVLGPAAAHRLLVDEHGQYPDQPTSWSGVYHVLQRYGGFVALRRFTKVFDEAGMFRKLPAEP